MKHRQCMFTSYDQRQQVHSVIKYIYKRAWRTMKKKHILEMTSYPPIHTNELACPFRTRITYIEFKIKPKEKKRKNDN